MSIIDLAEAILKQYPNLTYSVEGGTITVAPPTNDGFSVSLSVDEPEGEFVVSFEVWALGMENECAAINCFVWGLTDRCRLKIEKRGDKASVWEAEFKHGNDWIGVGRRIYMIFVPFWRKKSVEYRQNSLIEDTQGFGPTFNPEEGATAVIKLLESAGVQYSPKVSLEEEFHLNIGDFGPTEIKLHELIDSQPEWNDTNQDEIDIEEVVRKCQETTSRARSYCSRIRVDDISGRQTVSQWRIDFVRPDRWFVSQEVLEPHGTVYDQWISISSDTFHNVGFWTQAEELDRSDFNKSTSIDAYLDILNQSEPASVKRCLSNSGEHIIIQYTSPLPNERKNPWIESFNQPAEEGFSCFLVWVNTSTWHLERVDCRANGLLVEGEDGIIVQAFTCFDENVVVDPPPWLNTKTDSEGNMVITGEDIAVVEHHR